MSLHPDIYGKICRQDALLAWAEHDRQVSQVVHQPNDSRARLVLSSLGRSLIRLGEHLEGSAATGALRQPDPTRASHPVR